MEPIPQRGESRAPALACRIVELQAGGGDELPKTAEIPRTAWIEDVIAEVESGRRIWIFNPGLESKAIVEHARPGRTCLLELAAVFGDIELSTEETPYLEHRPMMSPIGHRAVGRVCAFYRDGVVIEVGGGSIGVPECIDDRFEPGRFLRVSDARLDFVRLIAIEDSKQDWVAVDDDPFFDPIRGLAALRSGEAQTHEMPAVELDANMKELWSGREPYLTLWGHHVSGLIYRFGETGLLEAEPDVVSYLEHGDTFVRGAAIWVLSRYWGLTRYAERLLQISVSDESVDVRRRAIVGAGILLRGTRDARAAAILTKLIRDPRQHWIVREGSYLALLSVWLPETIHLRESWPGWKPLQDTIAKRDSWETEWADRVDWRFVSGVEHGSFLTENRQ